MSNSFNNKRNNDTADIRAHHSSSPTSSTSSTTSSDASSPDFVLYSDRSEWRDVQPVPQDDGPTPVVSIAYSQRFRDTFDYFRAVLKSNEMSERALELTADCASLNPSNYTIWYFRRLCIRHLKRDLFVELKYIESVIIDNPKNYQVWHHRKCVVEEIMLMLKNKDSGAEGDIEKSRTNKTLKEVAEEEKVFVAYMISQDSKNYHGWQHRQWVIKEFDAWNGEIEYTEQLLDDDIRNNSAWNHRHYVMANTAGFSGASLETEIAFTCGKVSLTPHNESAWNYLRGVLSDAGLNSSELVRNTCEKLARNPEKRSSYLLGFLVDCIEETLVNEDTPNKKLLDKALEYCEDLALKTDPIRKEYWNYIARQLIDNYSSISSQ